MMEGLVSYFLWHCGDNRKWHNLSRANVVTFHVEDLTSRKFFYAGMLDQDLCLSETVYTYLCHCLQCKFTPHVSLIPDLRSKFTQEQLLSWKRLASYNYFHSGHISG